MCIVCVFIHTHTHADACTCMYVNTIVCLCLSRLCASEDSTGFCKLCLATVTEKISIATTRPKAKELFNRLQGANKLSVLHVVRVWGP